MTRTTINYKTGLTLLLLLGLTVTVLTFPPGVRAYSGEDFLTQLRTKFKTTSNIYLKAQSTRFEHNPTAGDSLAVKDTATITLAYAYPRKFLQEISGTTDRSQQVILKDDSAIVSYPHLDFRRRYSLEKDEITRLLIKHIPIAGALLGVSSGAVDGDSITTNVRNGNVFVTIRTHQTRFPYRVLKGKFDRDNLRPHYLLLRGQHDYRLDIFKYVEEERFPLWIEKAFVTMDLKWFRDSSV